MSLLSLSLFLASGHVAASNIYTDNVKEQRKMFENFKVEHERTYESAEAEAVHFDNFVMNLKSADHYNAQSAARGEDTVFGITSMSDRNMTAFGAPVTMTAPVAAESDLVDGHRKLPSCDDSTSSLNKDWTNVLTTAVNNAGFCGGNWAFAVAQQIESDAMREFSSSYVLSAQQLIQCVTTNSGCNTVPTSQIDVANTALDYAKTTGLYLSSTYPYTSFWGNAGGQCQASTGNDEKVRVDGYFSVLTNEEGCMAHYVQNTGPLAVCMNMGGAVRSYAGGIMSAATCADGGYWNTHSTYCAQVVGVNLVTGTTPYWKIRASAGTGWGEGGYVRVAYGVNACAIKQRPVYTSVLVEGNF